MMTWFALLAIATVRNFLVFFLRGRRLDEISAVSRAEINSGVLGRWEARYVEFEAESYEAMLFDLRRWTYRQFYPQEVA